MDPDHFERALKGARPGTFIPYHRGFLLEDRKEAAVDRVARRAMKLHASGWCELLQKKIDGTTEYLALRTRRAA